MGHVETAHGSIFVSEQGSGPPLLLLPANPGTHRDWDAVAAQLARDHRVISLDWPGFGKSSAPSPPSSASAMLFAEVARDVVHGMDLRGLTVIGNSVGGYSAVRLALSDPDRVASLVLVNSGGFTERTAVARAFTWLKGHEWVTGLIATAFARAYLRVHNEHARAVLERTEEGRKNPVSVAVDAAVWRSFGQASHDLRHSARALRVPVLIAWGDRDPVVSIGRDGAAAHRAIAGSEFVSFHTGHMPFVEAPDEFVRVVRAFLAKKLPLRGRSERAA
jgi:pimeloyl-ACP methyl ester carboxylesterase